MLNQQFITFSLNAVLFRIENPDSTYSWDNISQQPVQPFSIIMNRSTRTRFSVSSNPHLQGLLSGRQQSLLKYVCVQSFINSHIL